MERLDDLQTFYKLLGVLEQRLGGRRILADCSGRLSWPPRGVYFFFEGGEERSDSGTGSRVVRVGTHALNAGSGTTLWNRLSQHRGTSRSGGGNHRGSIFRLLAGEALLRRDGVTTVASWGIKSDPGAADARFGVTQQEVRASEYATEAAVSRLIGAMSVLWLDIGDEPGPESRRGFVERNSIALLSNYDREPLDAPSPEWLGHHSAREKVRRSGLWNNRHVDEPYAPEFLHVLESLIGLE